MRAYRKETFEDHTDFILIVSANSPWRPGPNATMSVSGGFSKHKFTQYGKGRRFNLEHFQEAFISVTDRQKI
jgi:hypothetical protein